MWQGQFFCTVHSAEKLTLLHLVCIQSFSSKLVALQKQKGPVYFYIIQKIKSSFIKKKQNKTKKKTKTKTKQTNILTNLFFPFQCARNFCGIVGNMLDCKQVQTSVMLLH